MRKLTITGALVFVFLSSVDGQNCAEILHGGIYDLTQSTSETARTASFVNWFKLKEFSSYEEAKKYGLNAVIPVDGILVGVGLTADEKGFQQFKRELEHYQAGATNFSQKLTSTIQTINQGVVNAWTACISQSGMHIWTEQSQDPMQFFVKARYIDDGAATSPKLVSFSFAPLAAVQVSEGAFFDNRGRTKNVTFSGATLTQAFSRKKLPDVAPGVLASAVTVTVNASRGTGLAESFPMLMKPRPFVRDFHANPQNVIQGAASTLSWDTAGATTITIDTIQSSLTPTGSYVVTPLQTTTYTLKASNESGSDSASATVSVDQAKFVNASITFNTTGNDKDSDTRIEVHLKKSDGSEVSFAEFGNGQHFDDNSTNGPYALPNNRAAALKSEIQHGIVTIKIAGSDKWKYRPKIALTFSDGTTLSTDWLGVDHDLETSGGRFTGDDNWPF